MSDKRKLLAEVDRTLKKVQEGMDIFDEIWAKVQEAASQTLKEKFEQDLKKEIKKLQRLRDQIKTWIASSSEIKDKDPLLKARRDIETKMEKFKDVERETKTKVYSKVGLAQTAKMDINQQKKAASREILAIFIDKMNCDLEQHESEREDLEAGARKKKLEKDKQEKVEFLRNIMELHRSHIDKMEIMLRMLDNDSLDPDQVSGLEDDIQFYLDKADEGIVEDINYIYENIDLEETMAEANECPGSPEPSVNSKDSDETKKKRPADEAPKPTPKITMPLNPSRLENVAVSKISDSKPLSSPPPKLSSSLPLHPPQPPLIAYAAAAAKALPQAQPKPAPVAPAPTLVEEHDKRVSDSHLPEATLATASLVPSEARRPSAADATVPMKSTTPLQFPLSASPRPHAASIGSYASSVVSAPNTPQPAPVKDPWKDPGQKSFLIKPTAPQNGPSRAEQPQFTAQPVPPPPAPVQVQPTFTTVPPAVASARAEERPPPAIVASFPAISETVVKPVPGSGSSFGFGHSRHVSEDFSLTEPSPRSLSSSSPPLSLRTTLVPDTHAPPAIPPITKAELESRITPNLAIVPLGTERPTREMVLQHSWLEAAFHNPPKPCDSERKKAYIPCIQCQIPSGWPPQPPMPLVCDMKFYGNLAADALFFIFYFQEGSLAQILAAKTLKSKNWRFHKQLNAWFQRLEEPKVTTTEYERGNYKFWDLDSWSEKQKNDFTFEYRFLENVDLNKWPYV